MNSDLRRLLKRYKYIIGGVLIFLIVFTGLYLSIIYMHESVVENRIYTETDTIIDKYYGNGQFSNYYLFTTSDNKTFSLIDNKYAKEIYDNVEIGKEYRLVLQTPDMNDPVQYTHILQVHNVTR